MKYRLAEAMKNCMKKMPVEKITVKEIVAECGTTRQTFYRNFQDKYDLINWYFDRILLESFQHMGEGKTAYEGLVNKFHYIEEEKLFFKAAFRNDDQNCLRDHDFQLILRFYENQIQAKTKQPIPENLHFQLEMYCQGSVYMTTQWVLGDMKKRPEKMAENLVKAMPAELETLFKKLGTPVRWSSFLMSKYVSARCHLNNTIHLEILCIKDIKLQKYKSVTCKCYKIYTL